MKKKGKYIPCEICGTEKYYKPFQVKNGRHKFCTRKCLDKFCSIQFSGAGNPSFGKTYRTKKTHPEWVENISKTSKGKINLGDKNGMKDPDARARQSKTRREKVTSDPEYRKARSEDMKKAWASGAYDNVSVGKCKWYDHARPDGSTVKLQGTWEVAFARRLDELGVQYETHRGRWSYTDSFNAERSYYPDFFVPMWDVYIDVKGAFWSTEQSDKIKHVLQSNPDKNLVIADKIMLDSWHVKLLDVQRELLDSAA